MTSALKWKCILRLGNIDKYYLSCLHYYAFDSAAFSAGYSSKNLHRSRETERDELDRWGMKG